MKNKLSLIITICLVALASIAAQAQTTTFTYQGKLNDASMPANGTYDFEFALFDALTVGTQIGLTQTVTGVTVTNGIFTVQLDFGAAAFPGANRFLEIRVKKPADASYTPLAPRQPVTSTPYAIRALTAGTADTATTATNATNATTATTATNAQQLGGVAASQFTQNDSQAFIRNQTTQQTSANFNIDSTGKANIFDAMTQYNIGGNRVLSVAGTNNFFAGANAGTGASNTGISNAFVGASAGRDNTTGNQNSFVGFAAGAGNTTGSNNSFFGTVAGQINTVGEYNTVVGSGANLNANNRVFTTLIGANALATGNDQIVLGKVAGTYFVNGANTSRPADTVLIPGNLAVVGAVNTSLQYNIGGSRVLSVAGTNNLFAGLNAGTGAANTGSSNAFVGANAGQANTTGLQNSFVGSFAGGLNTTGRNNSFFGTVAGQSNTVGEYNTVVGSQANLNADNRVFTTLIGANALATGNDQIVLGKVAGTYFVNGANTSRPADTVLIPGNLVVTGSITGASKSFKIDYPLDPLNKTLTYTSIESPDIKNIYDGNVTTDGGGEATVKLPDYFEALNKDYRYQLTVIGTFAQAIVSDEIKGNSFKIRTDKPGVKVSWQVTGIRRDKFAEDSRAPNVRDKPAAEKGTCLYAPACGAAASTGVTLINPRP